jgi:hypothetical protein
MIVTCARGNKPWFGLRELKNDHGRTLADKGERLRKSVDLFSLLFSLGHFFGQLMGSFTYETRRGRESNPRIAVLQTATLPLGYPAKIASEIAFSPMRILGLSIDS